MAISAKNYQTLKKSLIFSKKGEVIITEIECYLNKKKSPFYKILRQRKTDLEIHSGIVKRSPSLIKEMNILGKNHNIESLKIKIKEKRIDWVVNMPTKVALGFGFTVSLLHFWGFLIKLTFKFKELKHLKIPVEEEYSKVLYSLMAEELYRSLLSSKYYGNKYSDYIINELIELWENRLKNKTHIFAPYIKHLWEARQSIVPILGTLMGSMELIRLNSLLSPKWLDFLEWYITIFNDNGDTLEEFLFDLKYEEITLLRTYMKNNLISAVDRKRGTEIISNILKEPASKLRERQEKNNLPQSLQLFQSFLKRSHDCNNRIKTKSKGPKQTLEELFLFFIIENIV